jgi:RNA polymerase sigma-70 factor (ECF subfamily)
VRRELYDECVRVAALSAPGSEHARDLAHDVLLDAVARGRTGELEGRGWVYGAMRRRAAFEARTAARRQAREVRWHAATTNPAASAWRFSPELLARLSPALRVVAALASAELQPREIRAVLRLSDTAFRKRVSDLGREVRDAARAGVTVVVPVTEGPALGPARAQLLATLGRHPAWAIASHDPDGHLLVFSRAGAHRSALGGNSLAGARSAPSTKESQP